MIYIITVCQIKKALYHVRFILPPYRSSEFITCTFIHTCCNQNEHLESDSQMTDYELKREEIIAKNKAKLKELGIATEIQAVNAETALFFKTSRPERRAPRSALPDDVVIPSRITRSATGQQMSETEAALPGRTKKTSWTYQLGLSLR